MKEIIKKILNRIRWWWLRKGELKRQQAQRAVIRQSLSQWKVDTGEIRRTEPLSAKEKVQREINDLHQMVQNWKKCDLTYYDPDGGNEWIYSDFTEKISQWLMPYVTELRRCEHLDELEIEHFMERISGEISDMRRLLGLPEPDAPRKVTPIRGE